MEGMVQLRLCIWTFNDTLGNTFATHAWIQLEGRLKAALYGKDRVMALPLSEMTQRRRCAALVTVLHRDIHTNMRATFASAVALAAASPQLSRLAEIAPATQHALPSGHAYQEHTCLCHPDMLQQKSHWAEGCKTCQASTFANVSATSSYPSLRGIPFIHSLSSHQSHIIPVCPGCGPRTPPSRPSAAAAGLARGTSRRASPVSMPR